MPSLFELAGYKIYFWSNENNEPIHVHVSKGSPIANSTKLWLTRGGNCIVANNNSKIPDKDLNIIIDTIVSNHFFIVAKWKEFYQVSNVDFYC
ncbi:MAG: DUF4160 domain-containing protein [Clostridia bacterium]|nr:DUF4160 domain-containing protein [Clostridia bacterium]